MPIDNDYIMKTFYVGLPPINEIRMKCGMSWTDLALKMGVNHSTLWRWAGGASIPLEQRIKLKEIMGLYGRGK